MINKHLAGRHNQQAHAGNDDEADLDDLYFDDSQNDAFPGKLDLSADYIDGHTSETLDVINAETETDFNLTPPRHATVLELPGSTLELSGTDDTFADVLLNCSRSDRRPFEAAFPNDTLNKFDRHLAEVTDLAKTVGVTELSVVSSRNYQITALAKQGFTLDDGNQILSRLQDSQIRRDFTDMLTATLASKGVTGAQIAAFRLVTNYTKKLQELHNKRQLSTLDFGSKEHTLGLALLLSLTDPDNDNRMKNSLSFTKGVN